MSDGLEVIKERLDAKKTRPPTRRGTFGRLEERPPLDLVEPSTQPVAPTRPAPAEPLSEPSNTTHDVGRQPKTPKRTWQLDDRPAQTRLINFRMRADLDAMLTALTEDLELTHGLRASKRELTEVLLVQAIETAGTSSTIATQIASYRRRIAQAKRDS